MDLEIMTPEQYRSIKEKIQKQMRHYDKTFVAKEYAYNKVSKCYGEITSQNLAGMYVDYTSSHQEFLFSTHWVYRDCVLFDNEKEMLAHKIKNG